MAEKHLRQGSRKFTRAALTLWETRQHSYRVSRLRRLTNQLAIALRNKLAVNKVNVWQELSVVCERRRCVQVVPVPDYAIDHPHQAKDLKKLPINAKRSP